MVEAVKAIKIDDEIRDLLPPLTEYEYKNLEQSILDEGCREAIVLWGEIIVDGHNRYNICIKHNISFNTVQKEFASRDEVINWIIKNQVGRRSLNDFQRIEIVHRCEDAVKAQAKQRMLAGKSNPMGESPKGASRDILGGMAGVSGKKYEHGVKVLESGSKEIIEAARKGKMHIDTAYKAVMEIQKQKQHTKAEGIEQGEDSKRQVEQAEQAEQEVSGTEKEASETEKVVSDGKKYRILYVDCVSDWEQAKQRLMNLPIVELGEDNSVFLLLATFVHILDAVKIMESRGYSYRTMSFIRDDRGRIRTYEYMCLIGTRGEVDEVEKLVKEEEEESRTYKVPEGFKKIILKKLGEGSTTDLLSDQRAD